MARPRKDDAARLVPASTNLRPAEYDRLCQIATRQDVPVAVVIRIAVARFLNCKTEDAQIAP
jgi:hypothetical protein